MSGLLEKDIRLLAKRKQTIIVFAILCVVLGNVSGGTFILGYAVFLFMVLGIGTISYDEADNGYPFLFTLPINSKTYVIEKYAFVGAMTLLGWIFAVLIILVGKNEEGMKLWEMSSVLPVMMIIISILLPLQLKFGMERSRVVYAIVMGATFVLVYVPMQLIESDRVSGVISTVNSISDQVIFAGLWIVGILVLLLSMKISTGIMDKKEL